MENLVPKEWDVSESVITPMASAIQYGNGVRWVVDQQRLEISREHDIPFRKHTQNQIYDLAVSYVKKLPHIPYRGLGLNYVVSIMHEDPLQWLTNRFLHIDIPDVELYMMPRFTTRLDDMTLNLSLGRGNVRREGTPTSSVVIDCNLHNDGPFKVDPLCDTICRWSDDQDRIATVLGKILGVL